MARLTVAAARSPFRDRDNRGDELFELYVALAARGIEIDVISLAPYLTRTHRRQVAPGVSELRIPRSPLHAHVERMARASAEGLDAGHLLATQQRLTPDFLAALESSARESSAVVAFGPHLAPPLAVWTSAPLIFDARAGISAADPILQRAVRTAALVLTASERQAAWLRDVHGADPAALAVVPVACATAPFARAAEGEQLVVVLADALSDATRAAAEARPEVQFMIEGIPAPPPAIEGEHHPPAVPANVDASPASASSHRLLAALSVARAAVLEPAPAPRAVPELLLAATAGTPLVAGADAADLGLTATAPEDDLLAAIDASVPAPVPVRSWDVPAAGLLEDLRMARLLTHANRPLRRPRRLKALSA